MAKITLPGLGLGAAAAYGYSSSEKFFESSGMGDIVRGFQKAIGAATEGVASSSGRSYSGANSTAAGETSLRAEVDRLHNLLSEMIRGQKQGGNGVTYIHTDPKTGVSYIVYPVVGVGLLFLYCRIRGISFTELLFVSRGNLAQFKNTVTDGFAKLWDEMKRQKDDFVSRLAAVRRGQDQLGENQKAMDERLRQVGDNVDDVRANTYQLNSHVQQLDDRMSEVHDGVLRTNHGIVLLCSTVAEVTNRIGMHNSKTSQALKSFVGGQHQVAGGFQPECLPGSEATSILPAECTSPGPQSASSSSGLRGLLGVAPTEVETIKVDAGARVSPMPPSVQPSKSFGLRFF